MSEPAENNKVVAPSSSGDSAPTTTTKTTTTNGAGGSATGSGGTTSGSAEKEKEKVTTKKPTTPPSSNTRSRMLHFMTKADWSGVEGVLRSLNRGDPEINSKDKVSNCLACICLNRVQLAPCLQFKSSQRSIGVPKLHN